MTRIQGIRDAAVRLLHTEVGSHEEIEAARVLKAKLVRCSLSPVDGYEYARAILALLDEGV